jgi:hypothetical protein
VKRRFVVQQHEVRVGDVHFDLMIEDGAALVTFQLATAPPARGRRSFDHRPAYLDYEGPISGDRGVVRIWDRGEVEDVEGAPRDARWLARVRGARLSGTLEVRASSDAVEVLLA